MKDKKNYFVFGLLAAVIVAVVFGILKIIHFKKREEKGPTFYELYGKRALDIGCSLAAILCFGWLYAIVALLVKVKLGSPVLFTQPRPGKDEKIFKMYKFRTMTDERDENGELLTDEIRLTSFGKWLRSTSLDELPEAFNILKGDMSIIGPRPQLVRDMVFMTDEQRKRHSVRPGLSGLAQVNGRNDIDWEDKLNWDLKYIKHISFWGDLKIVVQTVMKAFVKKEGITEGDMATAEDFGDYLLKKGKVSKEEYDKKQEQGKMILNEKSNFFKVKIDKDNHEPFSVAMSVYKSDDPVFFDRALNSITEMQTIMPNEIVLIVDGPVSDELNKVIDKYEKCYEIFKTIRLEKNGGLGNALRIAVENASYELIARMDSDDVSLPGRFEEQLQYFAMHSDVDIVGGDITEFIGDESNIVGKRVVPTSNSEIREYMKIRCAMNHVSVMYRKSSVQNAGSYQDWFWNEDYYLWIRMWLKGAYFANTGTVLVNVRVGEEMYQRRGGDKYFESEKGLQDYMLKHEMISRFVYIKNLGKRLIVQKLMPNKLRGWIFRTFARKKGV